MRWLAVLVTVSCASPGLAPSEPDRVSATSKLVGLSESWDGLKLSRPGDPWYVDTTAAPSEPAPPPPELPARLPPPARIASHLLASTGEYVASVHSTQISIVAVSEDGSAAVTADQRGSLRVWPALDGTREPLIVPAPAAAELAVIRLADGFAIAVIDHAGQLEVRHTSEWGRTLSRSTLELPRPLVEVHALATGMFVALRDDRAVVAIDRDGSVTGTLAAAPGVRIAALAVRNNRVLAILDSGDEVHGQWINVIPRPVWGDATATLPIKSLDRVVLSPDHSKLASATPRAGTIAIVDVVTGRGTTHAVEELGRQPLTPIGFVDDQTLALSTTSRAVLWREKSGIVGDDVEASVVPAIANGKLVGASSMHLTVLRPGHAMQELGYRVTNISAVRRRANGWLLTDGAQVVRVDDQLHEVAAYEQAALSGVYLYGTTLLDGERMLAVGDNRNASAVYLIDHTRGTSERIVDGTLLGYEPSTGVAAFRVQQTFELARFDVKTGQFGPRTSIPILENTYPELMLMSRGQRALARIIALDADGIHATSTDIKAIPDAGGGALRMKRPHTIELPSSFFDEGSAALRTLLPASRPTYTSPDRSRVAELDGARIRLRDSTGTELWTIAAAGTSGLAWTPNNELIAFGSGMAKLDVATGARIARQCGWRFGLWSDEGVSFGGGELCEAP